MIGQHEYQTVGSLPALRQEGAGLVEKVGWGMAYAAAVLLNVIGLLLAPAIIASPRTGWILLAAFLALITGGLAVLTLSRPIERLLLRWQLSRKGQSALVVDGSWEEHWERLMQVAG